MKHAVLWICMGMLCALGCSGSESELPPIEEDPVDCKTLCSQALTEGEQPLRLREQALSCLCNGVVQCREPSDCEGRIAPDCPGRWSCPDTFCSWECDAVDCGTVFENYARLADELSVCEEGITTCSSLSNPLCGVVPGAGCWLPVSDSAQSPNVRLRQLALQYGACNVATEPCACGPEPVSECIDGRCLLGFQTPP